MKINFHHKGTWKVLSVTMLVGIFFTFNQCVVQQYDAPVVKNSTDEVTSGVDPWHGDPVMNSEGTGTGEFEETGATVVSRLVTDVGFKDFEQIYITFQILTGVDISNEGTLRSVYADLQSQLPVTNNVKSFSTAHQIAIIKLASEFCHTVFNKTQYYNSFFNNFNIGQTAADAYSQAGKYSITQEFINKFWGESVQPFSVEQTAKQEMGPLIDDLLVGTNMNSTTTTRTVAKGVCTSILSSAPVTTL